MSNLSGPYLDRVCAEKELELPLVARSALPDVVEQGEPGQVLVRLQVQLEVGLHNKVLFTMHMNT